MRRPIAVAVILLMLAGSTAGAAADGGADAPSHGKEPAPGPRDEITPDGLYWCNIKRITFDKAPDGFPKLAVSANGTAGVGWERNGQFMWKLIDRLGNELKAERMIPNGTFPMQGGGFAPACIGVDSKSNYHFVFSEAGTGVFYCKMDGNGNMLVPKKSVPSGASQPHNPSIAVARNDIVHIIYEDFRFGYDHEAISYARLLNDGTLDKDGILMSREDQAVSGSTVCADLSNNVHAIYVDSSPLVFHAKLDNFGNPLPQAPPARLYTPGGAMEYVGPGAVCADGTGAVHVVWNSNGSGVGRLMYMKLDNNGNKLAAGWSEKGIPLTENETAMGYPSIAADSSGTAYAVWSDNRDGAPNIWYTGIRASFENDTKLPDRAIRLTNDTNGSALEPNIALDADNHLHVVWKDAYEGNYELFYRFAYDSGVEADMASEEFVKLMYIRPNESKSANITVRNTGGLNDTVRLNLTTNFHGHAGWFVKLEALEIVLKPGETRKLKVTVKGAPDGLPNEYIDTSIVALSDLNPASNSTIAFRSYMVSNRQIILGCSDRTHTTAPGVATNYSLYLVNKGDYAETINITADGPWGWAWEVSPPQATLGPAGSAPVFVELTPPGTAGSGEMGMVKVTARASSYAHVASSVYLETRVEGWDSVAIRADGDRFSVLPGRSVDIGLSVSYNGSASGSVAVVLGESHAGTGWGVSFDTRTLLMFAGESQPAVLTVSAPEDAAAGMELGVEMEALAGNATASCNLTVVVGQVRALSVAVVPASVSAAPGETAVFGIDLKNAGNDRDEVRLGGLRPPPGWNLSLRLTDGTLISGEWNLSLRPGAGSRVIAWLAVPADARVGEYRAAGEFLDGAETSYRFEMAVSVSQFFGVKLSSDMESLSGEPGETLRFPLELCNTGNGKDTFLLKATLGAGGWADPFFLDRKGMSIEKIALEPGSAACVTLAVGIPKAPSQARLVIWAGAESVGGPSELVMLAAQARMSDLVISAVELSPSRPVQGRVVAVNVTVENRGDSSARNVSMVLYRNGEAVIPRELGDIPPKGKHVESFVWIPRAGGNVLVFIVDPEGLVPESNETNNTAMVMRSFGESALTLPRDIWWVAGLAAVPVAAWAGLVLLFRAGRKKKK